MPKPVTCLVLTAILASVLSACVEAPTVAVTASSGAANSPSTPAQPLRAKRGAGFWPTSDDDAILDKSVRLLKQGADIACVQLTDPFERVGEAWAAGVRDKWLTKCRAAGLELCIALEPFNDDRSGLRVPRDWRGAAPVLSDAAWQASYREAVLDQARRYKPEYLNVAVEANMYYRAHPVDWEAFRMLFRSLRTAIAEVSPATTVLCSYQYEVLNGTFLGKTSTPQWELIEDKAVTQDCVGISSYPLFLTSPYDPGRVPADYYEPLGQHTRTPLFFSELGWYSSPSVKPPSSPEAQALFIGRVPELLSGLDVRAVCWVNISDLPVIPQLKGLQDSLPQFFSLALCDSTLEAKPAWNAWLKLPQGSLP